MTPRLIISAVAALVISAAGSAAAQDTSRYDCHALETADDLPVLEGKNGFFYRLNLNMRTFHPLSEDAARTVGELSRALAEQGTQLIYVPVPTKSLAMPQFLPDHASGYGYDADLAQTAYQDFLAKLRDAGVSTVDTVAQMRTLPEGKTPFTALDFHWSPYGAQAAAEGVARIIDAMPELEDMERTEFEMTSTGFEPINSPLRDHIQAFCRDTVPIVETERFDLVEVQGNKASGGIFAADTGGPPIALVGTSMSEEEAFNFADALSMETQAQVANYAITGGNQFGSIISYIMSEDFRRTSPRVLVWENPIYNNLGGFGALPLRQLIASVGAECTPLETEQLGETKLAANLPDGRWTRESYLGIDTGRANGRRAETIFTTRDGLTETALTERPERYEPSRWFFEYARPLLRNDFARVEVTLDQPVTSDASLSTCLVKGAQS